MRGTILNALQSVALLLTACNGLSLGQLTLPLGLRSIDSIQIVTEGVEANRQHAQITFGRTSLCHEAYSLKVPINHFPGSERYRPHSNETFDLYYYQEAKYYLPGGPVFVLMAGETSAKNRWPFLESGILDLLARQFNGVGVILEHRYYGRSHVMDDLSTDSLRFLTTEQSLADSAYFVQNVHLPKIGKIDLSKTPVIFYGGSYAGGQAAFMRHLYPWMVFGAIASSAVTHAEVDAWRYMEAIRQNGPPECISALEENIEYIDQQLDDKESGSALKSLFGLGNLTNDADFANILSLPLSGWQGQTWQLDPANNIFFRFCNALLPEEKSEMPKTLLSHARFIKDAVSRSCSGNQDECFGSSDRKAYQKTDLQQTWRLWTYQYCTEWGYFIGAAPKGRPSLLSRRLDIDYVSRICKFAFPPGKYNSVPSSPNVTQINKYGDFALAHSRLAFIDGTFDPWIFATPHSSRAPPRNDTQDQPFKIIPGGVHHYDEYGSKPTEQEPTNIVNIHSEIIGFIGDWLSEFNS